MPSLSILISALLLSSQATAPVQSARTVQARALPGTTGSFQILAVSNGFGALLPHRILEHDGSGGFGPAVVDVRSFDQLLANVVAGQNEVLPPVSWPVGTTLPNGAGGNHFLVARFTEALDVSSVLDASAAAAANSQLTGAITVVAVDPGTGAVTPIQGRAFVDGRTYGSPNPVNPGQLELESWIGLDGTGKPVALPVGGGTPGLGFPGTEDAVGFAGAADLVAPNALVFVPDADGDLTTHETFPAGQQIRMGISTAVLSEGGAPLEAPGLATSTVGADQTEPEVALGPGGVPQIVPGNGDVGVDPEAPVRVRFTEPVRLSSVGALSDGTPPPPSAAIQLTFGSLAATTSVPFSVSVDSVYDLSEVVLEPAFAFPGAGAAGACGSFSQVSVDVAAMQVVDLAGNANALSASTFFETGAGPGLVNAPVTPDAIYLTRAGASPGLSVLDLNGFGGGTGNPTYDLANPVVQGNSNFPNNPNVALQGAILVPNVPPGSCTHDGGSAGVFTLTKDTNLSDLAVSSPILESVADVALGAALDRTFNAGVPFGCQSGGGNLCASTGLKLVRLTQGGPNTCAPAGPGAPPLAQLIGAENLASWAPHPNPPPLVFPPLCVSPLIGGQEPTSVFSVTPPPQGQGLQNLLVPGPNVLGNPALGIPPVNILAKEQNAWFQGPSPPQASVAGCQPYMMRQQVGQFLYVADRAANQIVVLNSNRFLVVDRIGVSDPTSLAMSPNVDFLAITSQATNTLHFLDVRPDSSTFHEVVQVTTVGAAPGGVAWEPGNEDILVCNTGDATLSIVSAFDFQVRKTVGGAIGRTAKLGAPVDVAITPRQTGFGWQRGVYFAWVIDASGQLALFESGPNGVNGWGYDDFVGVAPFPLAAPKAIQPDLVDLRGAVWIAHEEPLKASGGPTGAPGGAVTRVLLTSDAFGAVPLDPAAAGSPQLRGLGFEVTTSVGEEVLTGVPTDLAFDDLRNVTALPNRFSVYSAGFPAQVNGKGLAKEFAGGVVPVSSPSFLFVAVPSSAEGPGVVDVLELGATLARFDTDPFQVGVQSVPAAGVTSVAGYLRQ